MNCFDDIWLRMYPAYTLRTIANVGCAMSGRNTFATIRYSILLITVTGMVFSGQLPAQDQDEDQDERNADDDRASEAAGLQASTSAGSGSGHGVSPRSSGGLVAHPSATVAGAVRFRARRGRPVGG